MLHSAASLSCGAAGAPTVCLRSPWCQVAEGRRCQLSGAQQQLRGKEVEGMSSLGLGPSIKAGRRSNQAT